MTLVSVLMPIKGDCPYLSYAIQSVRLQSFGDWELVICKDLIDGASSGYLEEIVALDSRIRLVDTVGLALPAALNRGLGVCKGDFIARFDADDIMLPGRLSSQVIFLQNNPDYVVCGGQIVIIDEYQKLMFDAPYYNLKNRTLKGKLDYKCPFPHPGATIRTKALKEIHGYSPQYKFAEDYELWLRLSHLGKFANLKKSVIAYRSYTSQTSARYRAETLLCMAVALVREFNRAHPDHEAIDSKIDAELFRKEYSLLDESKKKLIIRLYRNEPFLPGELIRDSKRNLLMDSLSSVTFFLTALPRRSIQVTLKFLNTCHGFLRIRPLWNEYLNKLNTVVVSPPTSVNLEK
jgi:glycosyltransferase involved in cell wall biosynthesis